jgi:hypothetical protein
MKRLLLFAIVTGSIVVSAPAYSQVVLPRSGWVATASTTNSGEPASRAIDGSGSTRWSTGVPQTQGQWFSIDMQTPQTFSQVTIDPKGSTNDWTRAYQVFVSNDAVSWGEPVASGTGSAGVLTVIFPTQTARFIGVVQTGSGSNWWSIGEINVYGPGATPTALLSTTGWIASASATGGSDVPSHAIDGSLGTRWSSGIPQVNGQWFQLDMLQQQTVTEIVMNSDGSSSDYARGYQLFVSNSASAWGSPVASGVATSSPITVTFPPAAGRYLTIVQTGSATNWWSIAELSVYGVGTFAPVAIVLPRTGWSASAPVSCSSDVPANALDDNLNTRFSTCQNQAIGQSFQIDMQAPVSFTKITMDAGGSSDYPRSFAVYATNDPSNWGSPIAMGAGSSSLVTVNFPYRTARYIKVVLTASVSTNWWSIHEFNVFGIAPTLILRDGWVATASLNATAANSGIDGVLSTRWTTNAPQVSGQWYQLDMLAPQSFNQVTVTSDGYTNDFPNTLQVFASNSPSTFGAPIATVVGSSAMLSASFPIQFARYIRLVQTGSSSHWWSIAEANVWLTTTSDCIQANGTPAADWSPCNDGDVCTRAKVCRSGVCTGGQPTCEDGDPCTTDVCDESSGACQHVVVSASQCTQNLSSPLALQGRVSFAAEADNNRCVPDAVHVLNRLNAHGDLMAWQYLGTDNNFYAFPPGGPGAPLPARLPPLDKNYWHTETIVRMPYFGAGSTAPAFDGTIFAATWPSQFYPTTGVAKLGKAGGHNGRFIGTNRAFNYPGNVLMDGSKTGDVGEWVVTPNAEDAFIPTVQVDMMHSIQTAFPDANGVIHDLFGGGTYDFNHPGGASALGTHLVVPLSGFEYNDCGCSIFECRDTIFSGCADLCICPTTQQYSSPIVQIIDLVDPMNPVVRESFMTELPSGGHTPTVSTAITKLADGRFLLAVYKDAPVNAMEFYLSQTTNLDDPNLFKQNLGNAAFGTTSFGFLEGTPDAVISNWSSTFNWQSFNFITDCSGQLYVLGMTGDSDTGNNTVDNFQVNLIPSTGSPCPNGLQTPYCAEVISVDTFNLTDPMHPVPPTAPVGSSTASENPLGREILSCQDDSNQHNEQCQFVKAAGSYVDPNGQIVVYSTEPDNDGGNDNPLLVYGNGYPTLENDPPQGNFLRGIEFHERHGNYGVATSCPTLDDAWVELYEGAEFSRFAVFGATAGGDRSYRLDYANRFTRSSASIGEDPGGTSSIRWCLPPGSSVEIFNAALQAGSWAALNGTGSVAEIHSLTGLVYPHGGGPIEDHVVSLKFVDNSTDPQALSSVPDLGD